MTTPTGIRADEVRRFMRDYAGVIPNTGVVNILLDGPEFSDADVQQAITYATDVFTYMPPVIGVFISSAIPKPILLWGVVAYLLRSESVRQLRNQAQMQDGDTQNIGIDDKHPQYIAAADIFDRNFAEAAKPYKIHLNILRAYGGIGSGYAMVSRNFNS